MRRAIDVCLLLPTVTMLVLSPQQAYSDDEVIATSAAAGPNPADVLSLLGIEDPATRAGIQGHPDGAGTQGLISRAKARREGGDGSPVARRGRSQTIPRTGAVRRQTESCASIQPQLHALLNVLLPAADALAALRSCEDSIAAVTAAGRQIPAVVEQYDLANEEALINALLALMPAAVAAPEPTVAYEALVILDKRITDRPGAPPSYRGQIASMWTELSTLLARDGSFIAADRSRWLGAERRARLPPDFEDSHPSGFGYRLEGADTREHTKDHRRQGTRRCASPPTTLRTPTAVSSAKLALFVRSAVRNHLAELNTLISMSYLSSTCSVTICFEDELVSN